MANSDNVLRGGLTTKHLDVPELLSLLTFDGRAPEVLTAQAAGPGERVYRTPAREFELALLDVAAGRPFRPSAGRGVEVLLALEGDMVLRAESEATPLGRAAAFSCRPRFRPTRSRAKAASAERGCRSTRARRPPSARPSPPSPRARDLVRFARPPGKPAPRPTSSSSWPRATPRTRPPSRPSTSRRPAPACTCPGAASRGPVVAEADVLRALHDLLREVRRDEREALGSLRMTSPGRTVTPRSGSGR